MQHGKGRGRQGRPSDISLRHVGGRRKRAIVDCDTIIVFEPGLVDGENLDGFLCRRLGHAQPVTVFTHGAV